MRKLNAMLTPLVGGNNTIYNGTGDCVVYGGGGTNFINLESVKRSKCEAANDVDVRNLEAERRAA